MLDSAGCDSLRARDPAGVRQRSPYDSHRDGLRCKLSATCRTAAPRARFQTSIRSGRSVHLLVVAEIGDANPIGATALFVGRGMTGGRVRKLIWKRAMASLSPATEGRVVGRPLVTADKLAVARVMLANVSPRPGSRR